MDYTKLNRSCWLVLLLFAFACNDDDNPSQLNAPQLNDPQAVTSDGLTISWSEVSGADSYLLDIATDENFTDKVEGYDKKEVTGLSETVEGLEAATVYYFRVYAARGSEESAPSAVKEVMTDGPIAAPELNDPEDVTASGFSISWSAVEDAEAYL